MSDPSSDYGESVANQARNTGQSAINSFDPTGFANKTKQGFSDMFKSQGNEQNQFIDQYKQAVAQNPSVTDLYNQGNERYNVQPLQQNANQLQNAVLTAPQRNLDMARGFNVDANQVANQTAQQLGRLSPLAAAAQNQAQTAQTNANQYVQSGIAQNQQNLLPVQQQAQMQSDLWARQATGYTTAVQSELEGLMNKMNAGVQLSQSEMARANSLAQAESSYQQAQIQAQTSITNAQLDARTGIAKQQLANQNMVFSPAQTYLNTITGKAQRF